MADNGLCCFERQTLSCAEYTKLHLIKVSQCCLKANLTVSKIMESGKKLGAVKSEKYSIFF